jgi:hypothetical protein
MEYVKFVISLNRLLQERTGSVPSTDLKILFGMSAHPTTQFYKLLQKNYPE